MPLRNDEVNKSYQEVISGRVAERAAQVGGVTIAPEVIYRDALGEAISLPVNEGTDRDVYVRNHGGEWEQVQFMAVPQQTGLASFAITNAVNAAAKMLQIAAALLVKFDYSKEAAFSAATQAFKMLQRRPEPVTVQGIVHHVLKHPR